MHVSFETSGRLGQLDIYCVHAFLSALQVEGYDVAFADVVNETTYVNKNVLAGGVVNDETETLGFIEKLYFSSVHW